MSATAWAMAELRHHPAQRGGYGPFASVNGRAVILGLATLADEALDSPNGYMSSSDEQVGRLAGMATSTALSWLRVLGEHGLAVRLGTHSFRVPEVAFVEARP